MMALLMRGEQEAIIILLEKSKNKSLGKTALSKNGDTMLHYASANGLVKIVQYLGKIYPQLKQVKNKEGKMPKDLTIHTKMQAILE